MVMVRAFVQFAYLLLIVDDEPLARQRLRQLLARIPGTDVIGECEDGADAVQAIVEIAPEVVLLDVRMREMGGFAVVDAIGAERMPPVIFITAHDQFAIRAFDVHAVDYLMKPVKTPQLRVHWDAPPSGAGRGNRCCGETSGPCSIP